MGHSGFQCRWWLGVRFVDRYDCVAGAAMTGAEYEKFFRLWGFYLLVLAGILVFIGMGFQIGALLARTIGFENTLIIGVIVFSLLVTSLLAWVSVVEKRG